VLSRYWPKAKTKKEKSKEKEKEKAKVERAFDRTRCLEWPVIAPGERVKIGKREAKPTKERRKGKENWRNEQARE